MPRIVQARKPGSKPYLSLNIPKPPPDPDADRKVKAVFKKMMPNHPMLRMTTDGLPTGRGLGSRRDGDGRRRLWG